jgi:hypothetical protein
MATDPACDPMLTIEPRMPRSTHIRATACDVKKSPRFVSGPEPDREWH